MQLDWAISPARATEVFSASASKPRICAYSPRKTLKILNAIFSRMGKQL